VTRSTRSAAGQLAAARRLTDPEAADELLRAAAEHAGAALSSWRLRNVHHRASRSVSAVYEAMLDVDGQERDVLLVAHVDEKPLPPAAFVLRSGAQQVAVWRFPYDPYLVGLPSAVHRARVRELLDGLGGPPGAVQLRTRSYRPSRRAVVEVTIDGPEASGRVLYLKVLAGDRATELADLHRQLERAVPVPSVIGVAAHQGIVALEALGGFTLRSVLLEGGELPDPSGLVELSQRLAATEVRSRRDPARFADPTRHVELLTELVPDLGSRLERAQVEAAPVPGTPRVPVHGDLHDGQVLLDEVGTVTGLLDVDGVGRGFVAQDAGSLVAHVEVVGEVWPEAASRCASYASRLVDAYEPWLGGEALARGAASAWLALATGPHRAQEVDWEERTRHRVRRAEEWLARRASPIG
jgi:hypothetical protein